MLLITKINRQLLYVILGSIIVQLMPTFPAFAQNLEYFNFLKSVNREFLVKNAGCVQEICDSEKDSINYFLNILSRNFNLEPKSKRESINPEEIEEKILEIIKDKDFKYTFGKITIIISDGNVPSNLKLKSLLYFASVVEGVFFIDLQQNKSELIVVSDWKSLNFNMIESEVTSAFENFRQDLIIEDYHTAVSEKVLQKEQPLPAPQVQATEMERRLQAMAMERRARVITPQVRAMGIHTHQPSQAQQERVQVQEQRLACAHPQLQAPQQAAQQLAATSQAQERARALLRQQAQQAEHAKLVAMQQAARQLQQAQRLPPAPSQVQEQRLARARAQLQAMAQQAAQQAQQVQQAQQAQQRAAILQAQERARAQLRQQAQQLQQLRVALEEQEQAREQARKRAQEPKRAMAQQGQQALQARLEPLVQRRQISGGVSARAQETHERKRDKEQVSEEEEKLLNSKKAKNT